MSRERSPWKLLGVTPEASDDELRKRYAELIKQHPPDRDPEVFEHIRDAWLQVKDPRVRARERILGPPALHDLGELVDVLRPERNAAGAGAWLDALREMSR